MGAASSKAKSAPSAAMRAAVSSPPTMPSARAPPPPRERAEGSVPAGVKADREGPSFGKDQMIQEDAADPTLAGMLDRLGQVKVPHTGTPFKKENEMLDILSIRRAESDLADTGTFTNRLSARSLSNYLDDRKALSSRDERLKLAKEYGIEGGLLEEMARHYNSPSVSATPLRPSGTVEDDKEETFLAMWVDPPPEGTKKIESN